MRAIQSYPRAIRPDFAIHGHIDLDTIICYGEPEILEQCVLVISHFPRSISQPSSGSHAPLDSPTVRSPTYRPPEWDLEGGCVSESSDIWSLGCAYLEFITWLLGGKDLLSKFQDARQSPYLDGTLTDKFYTFMSSKDEKGYVLRVNSEVTEVNPTCPCGITHADQNQWMRMLRRHHACSDAIHQILDMIEGQMLLVLPPNRSSSLHLQQWFDFDLDEKFYSDGKPRKPPAPPILDVGVSLNTFWKEKMATGSQVELPMHDGESLIYLTSDQLRNPWGS